MFYYLPERVYNAVKESERLRELEDKFTELNKDAFDYSAGVVDERYRIGFRIQREVARCLKDAPPEIIREFKVMLSYANIERIQEFLKTEKDPENRLYLYQTLSNSAEVNINRIKNSFIYEYTKLTAQQKASISPILHSTYLLFMGEKLISGSTSLPDALYKTKNLKDELLRIPVELFPEKHNKMLSFTYVKLLNTAYQQHRYNATNKQILDMLNYAMDMSKWHDKVYDDIWIGNFCMTELLYNVMFDYAYRGDEKGLDFIANTLTSYLVTAFTNLDITIKTLTSNDAEYRMNFLALSGSCIRLLKQYNSNLVEEQILPAAPVSILSNISAYGDIDESETPISDFMGMQVDYEPQLIRTTTAEIELKMTSDYKLIKDKI